MNSRKIEIAVWLALGMSMLGVLGVFLADRPPAADPLPVISRIRPFVLTNQFGVRVTEESLDGYAWIGNVIFTRCPGQCRQMTQLMARLQKRLPLGAPLRLVSLTADPLHDTPEVLARYASMYSAEPAGWLFLTGTKPELYRVAIEDLRLSVEENDQPVAGRIEDLFLHSSAHVVVDRRGRVRGVVHLEDPGAEERLLRILLAVVSSPKD